jgi:hypothetical protein
LSARQKPSVCGLKIEDVVAFYACQHESDNIARGLIDELVYHEKDDDCKLDNPDGLPGTCVECGVYHDEPCPDCGGTGFHKDGCQEIE